MWRLRPLAYFVRQGWLQLVRDRRLTTTAVLANVATLFVSGMFLLIAWNLDRALDSIQGQREVQVYLADTLEPTAWPTVGETLSRVNGVVDAELITPEAALAEFERDFGESGLVEALGRNPLPATYRLTLADGFRTGDGLDQVVRAAGLVSGVDLVQFGGVGIAEMERRVRLFAILNLVVGVLAGLSAILIVGNTIRLTILAREELVEILKLIGAHDVFVRLPFVIEGTLQGFLAAAGAVAVLWGIHAAVASRVAGVLFFSPWVVVGFLGFAAILGGAGAWMATVHPLRVHWRKA